jgi:hypothetical protein
MVECIIERVGVDCIVYVIQRPHVRRRKGVYVRLPTFLTSSLRLGVHQRRSGHGVVENSLPQPSIEP